MILFIAHFFAITSFFACYKIKFKKISTEKKHLFVCLLNFFFVWLLNWIRGYLKRTKFRTILFSFRDTFLSKLIDTSTNLSILSYKDISLYILYIIYLSIFLPYHVPEAFCLGPSQSSMAAYRPYQIWFEA